MKVILSANVTWKGLSLSPVSLNRFTLSDKDEATIRTDLANQYKKLGMEEVEIHFTSMELPESIRKINTDLSIQT